MEVKPLRQGSVRAGYKQTEVGVIPEEWEIQTGEQITTLIGKGGSPRWQGFEYSNGGMLFITSENVRNGFLDIREPKYLPLAFHEKLKRTKLQKHDILVNLVGASIGRSCQIQQDLGEANVNQAVAVFRVKDEHSSAFLACCFQAPATIERILAMQVDAARPNISLGDLRRFSIQLPPLPEQRAIATALSDVDGLLRGLDRLIAKKRDLKQAAMQQLLTGQTRLPGFHGEWEVKRLGELATIKDGTHQTPRYVQTGVLFYSVEHVTSGDFTNTKYISEEEHKFLTRTAKIERGDILMTRIGSIGDCKLIDWDVEASFYVSLALLKIRSGYSAAFISHYSNTAAFKKEAELHSLQSAIPMKINLGPISNVKVELPPTLAEQTAIAEVLTEMDAELAALEQRGEKTRALKQAMMQELLTGRIRLVES
jgi:type I restriction enzyme, S subunit